MTLGVVHQTAITKGTWERETGSSHFLIFEQYNVGEKLL